MTFRPLSSATRLLKAASRVRNIALGSLTVSTVAMRMVPPRVAVGVETYPWLGGMGVPRRGAAVEKSAEENAGDGNEQRHDETNDKRAVDAVADRRAKRERQREHER